MVVRRIAPLSLAKLATVCYAFIGLIAGVFVSVLALAGAALSDELRDATPFLGAALGLGAIVLLPICYAVLGFIVGLVGAAIYNVAAGLTGGVEIDAG
jgi:hypothetical protein